MTRPLTVGLVQINSSFSNQHYLPYSVGLLEAYARRHAADPDRLRFLVPVHTRVKVAEAVARLADADVVGVSCYVWNENLSLAIARALKARNPRVRIVVGGPQVPDRAEAWLRANPCVDVAVHGEGEQVFLQILERLPDGDLDGIPSTSRLAADGTCVTTPRAARIADLASVPSPFLEGTFAPLLAANPGHQWLALWETNRGCPFQCTFCDWGSATAAKVARFDDDRLRAEVEWFADQRIEFVFCCDANFGMLPRDLELAAHVAAVKQARGWPHALSVQNTKNATDRAYQVQKLLSDAGLNKGVTLSLQSVDPTTLEAIRRKNISLDTYAELQRRFTRDGVATYSDLILGLPGETYASFASGVGTVIEQGQHNRIQFNNCSILPNAEMADPAYRARWGLETVTSRIINIHGALDAADDEAPETQELIVATGAMPRPEWVRARAFAWWAAFLHFDKLLQIPFVVLRHEAGLGWRELIEQFSELGHPGFPVLHEIRRFFLDAARDVQRGGPEYVAGRRWLPIWWPADEWMLIRLVHDGLLDAFYDEAELLLSARCATRAPQFPRALLREAMALNRRLLKVPTRRAEAPLRLHWDLWTYYRDVVRGQPSPLAARDVAVHVDPAEVRWATFDDWCREVVWYGNKKGAYLHAPGRAPAAAPAETGIAGHY